MKLRALLLLLPASVLASPAAFADDDAPGHQVDLHFGPLIGGKDMVLHVRSTAPNALTLAFFALGFAPTVLASPVFPVIGVSPPTSFLAQTTDANGQLRVTVPTVVALFARPMGRSSAANADRPLIGRIFAYPATTTVASN